MADTRTQVTDLVAGLGTEIAALLELSERTVERDWHFARAWLRRQLSRDSRRRNAAPAGPAMPVAAAASKASSTS